MAEDKLMKIYSNEITYAESIQEAITDAEICFIFTEWNQIKEIAPSTYKELMKKPVIYDGRNIYQPKDMKQVGVEYYSVGRDMNMLKL